MYPLIKLHLWCPRLKKDGHLRCGRGICHLSRWLFFAKCLRVDEDGPGWGHPCHLDTFLVLPCVILFLCFSVLLALRLPRLGERELILVLFVRLFDLRLFGFVGFSSSWCLGRAAVCETTSSKNFNQWVGAWRYVFGLARRGSTIGFHLLWHTVELATSTRLCLL